MRRGIVIAIFGFAFMAFMCFGGTPSPVDAESGKKVRWYSVGLESGETSGGYRWAVGAKGPRREPLREICALAGMIEPLQPDKSYVEGQDGSTCGDLRSRGESITEAVSFGSGESRVTAFVGIYRPAVRKVTFVLDSGERKEYLPRVPQVPNRTERGIPVFRFIADTFEGEPCVRRVITFDRGGSAISHQTKRDCPGGEPLVPLSR